MNSKDFFSARVANTLSPMDYLQLSKQNPNQVILVDVRNAPAHLKKVKIENAIEIPQNESSQKLLLRDLMNVREPKKIKSEFYRIQDAYLQTAIEEKGIVDVNDLKPMNNRKPFVQILNIVLSPQ